MGRTSVFAVVFPSVEFISCSVCVGIDLSPLDAFGSPGDACYDALMATFCGMTCAPNSLGSVAATNGEVRSPRQTAGKGGGGQNEPFPLPFSGWFVYDRLVSPTPSHTPHPFAFFSIFLFFLNSDLD